MKPFRELRVVELAGSEAGAYAGKLFADLGADVIKVESPSGDQRRRDGEAFGNVGTTFAYLNTSKKLLALEFRSGEGRQALEGLLAKADVLIESSAPGPLVPLETAARFPQLVHTQVSPFGSSGPYASFRSNYFTDEAVGGHLYLNGEPGREPIRRPGLHAAYQAGTHAFIGTMAALLARDRIGAGQVVEVSHFEGFASLHQHTTSMWTHGGVILRREGNRQPGQWHPVCIYPSRDGYVQLSMPMTPMVERFFVAAGLDHLLGDPRFADDFARGAHKDEFDQAILPWLLSHETEEIVALGQEVLIPIGPVPEMLDVVRDEHLAARDFWVELGNAPTIRVPRGPFRVDDHPFEPSPVRSVSAVPPGEATGAQPRAPLDPPGLPLEGIRILDLTRVWAGPFGGRLLADLGADVIAVEMPWGRGPRDLPPGAALISHLYPENDLGERPWNRVAGFNKLFRNRRGVTLDLRNTRAKVIFAALVKTADIVLENYSPRVMGQLGFDSDALRRLNPHVIHVSMPGFGASGPKANWVAFGPLIEASSGLSAMMGYRDSGPYRSGIAWSDPVAGMNAAAGALVALWDRAADPARRGRDVEVPMIEAMVTFVGEEIAAAQVRGANPPRRGNRSPGLAPQGCYPCAGDDRWIAISVTSGEEWRVLCDAASLGREWSDLGLHERQQQHDVIDALLSRWTRSWDPPSLMTFLQDKGVIATVVSDARDLAESPQLFARDFWARLDHPDVGPRAYPGTAMHLSRTPVTYRVAAPTLGQHNDEILGGELMVPADDLDELRRIGVIAETPPV